MKLIIDNQLRLYDIPEDLRSWFALQLTFNNPLYTEAVKHNRYIGKLDPHILLYKPLPNGIVLPRGYLQLIEDTMIGKGLDISIQDNRILLPPISVKSNINLRPYQRKAKYELLKHPNGILVSPAGSGKTIICLDIFASLHQKMLWLTHTNRLFDQVIDRILDMFPDVTKDEIGLIGNGRYSIGDRITIGMIPTLIRREVNLPEIGRKFGLVIIDECHHLAATTFAKVCSYFSSYYLYACTATTHRRDGLENMLYAVAGYPNAIIKRKEVKDEGSIVTPKLITRWIPALRPYEGNNFNYIISKLIIPNQNRLLLIVNDVVEEAKKGKYCIVISTRKQYCEMLFKEISKHWNKTVIATGDYSHKANSKSIAKVESGEATVLICTGALLAEGFDIRKLDREFIVLPLSGQGTLLEQYVGRIQRTHKHKKDAIIFDYVDDIGILRNQFKKRMMVYSRLGVKEVKNI